VGPGIQTYVINLDRHPARLAAFSHDLDRFGLDFERVAAVDALSLRDDEAEGTGEDGKTPYSKRGLSRAEVACFLSHKEIWRRISKGDAPFAMVCEDDARFDSRIVDLLQWLSGREPEWDILRLYSHKRRTPIEVEDLTAGLEAHTVGKITMSTVAYVITKPAARQLLRTRNPVFLPIDGYLKLWGLHGLCSKQVYPSVAWPVQGNSQGSTIEASRSRQKERNPLQRLFKNLRFQWSMARQRRKHLKDMPLTRQFR
jgi:glycosyl transferase family 25